MSALLFVSCKAYKYFFHGHYFNLVAMEILGAVAAEVGKCMSILFFSKISTLTNFHGNFKSLQNELEKLNNQKNEIEEAIRLAETEKKYPTTQDSGWIKKVEEIEREVHLMLEKGDHFCQWLWSWL